MQDSPTILTGIIAAAALAQTAPPESHATALAIGGVPVTVIVVILWGIVGIAGGANVALSFWRNITGHFQERAPQNTFVTPAECRASHTEVDRRLIEYDGKAEERSGKIYRRLDTIVETLHELKGTLGNHISEHRRDS